MKIKTNYYIGILLALLVLVPTACKDDIDPVIEELETSRAFAPVALEARIRNQVDIELQWTAELDVDQYVIEFFEDSLEFEGDPIATGTIDEILSEGTITFTATLEGETRYSARVKAIVEGKQESNWATVTAMTDPEQIFTSSLPLDIQGNSATVAWEPGSTVTNFLIVPGNIVLPISGAQQAAGQATITGLTGGTDYTVSIYNGTVKRGTIAFTTLKEADLTPLDDLGAAIDAADEGATLVLEAGTYNLGAKVITKSVTLEGQNPLDKPVILGQFACETAVGSFSLINLQIKGEFAYGQFFNAAAAGCNLGELNIEGCEISEYGNNIIYNNSGGTYGNITITNTYIHDIEGGGGDGFDFRGGAVGSLTVENVTISTGVRTLLRMQVPADVAFRNVTFYRVCIVASSNNRGFFRMSGGGGSLDVRNCLFVETGIDDNGTLLGVWSRAGDISEEVSTSFFDNYYYDVIGLFDGDGAGFTDPGQVDAAEADPGFEDPENGDFTITNQTLIDEEIGDSQWWN